MNIRQYVNEKFIQNNSNIVDEMVYHNHIYGRSHNILKRGIYVIGLYLKYVVLKKNFAREMEIMNAKVIFPESCVNQKNNIHKILEDSEKYENIYIDIENVVLFLSIDYKQILSLVEIKEHFIGLSDYYDSSLHLEEKIKRQIYNTLNDFILVNSRMIQLIKELIKKNHSVYFINNTEFPDELVKRIIEQNDVNVEFCVNTYKRGIHITKECRKKGDVAYENVNRMGARYRSYVKTNVVTSYYTQLVNLKFHSSENAYTLFYEYGYICGGILVCGFCQFLEKIAQNNGIEKFIFVARDGDIMQQVYKNFFNGIESSYLQFSRFASYELIFEDYPDEYIDKNIHPRIGRKETDNSIESILQECGIEVLRKHLSEEGLSEEQTLTNDSYDSLKKIILNHKDEVQECFRESCAAAKTYFSEQIKGKKKVCIVDLGWNGKSITYLKHLCERKYDCEVDIVGALIGASDNQIVQSYIRMGIIQTYAFENTFWRNTGTSCGRQMGYKECVCLEALFSSPNDTLLRYKFNHEGKPDFIYGRKNKNKKNIEDIHSGILDFANDFLPIIKKYKLLITPRDAYTPVDVVMRNQRYVDRLYEQYDEVECAINGFSVRRSLG